MADTTSYNCLTPPQLRKIAQERWIFHRHVTTKQELVELLQADDTNRPPRAIMRKRIRYPESGEDDYTSRKYKSLKRADYDHLTYAELENLIKSRALEPLDRTKEFLAAALVDADNKNQFQAKVRAGFEALARKRLEKGQKVKQLENAMWSRDFTADPSRRSFMDFPREIRNHIYGALFNVPEITDELWNLVYDHRSEKSGQFFNAGNHQNRPEANRILYGLKVLGALNKEIRKEARSTFWSLLTFKLGYSARSTNFYVPAAIGFVAIKQNRDFPHYSVVYQFLRGIGDEGRFAIKYLDINDAGPMDLSLSGCLQFKQCLALIQTCTSLMEITLHLDVSIFLHGEMKAVERFLFRGKPLHCRDIGYLRHVLNSLPKLRRVFIFPYAVHSATAKPSPGNRAAVYKTIPFMDFAFSHARKKILWAEVTRQIMQKPHNGSFYFRQTFPNYERDDERTLNYSTWLQYQDSETQSLAEEQKILFDTYNANLNTDVAGLIERPISRTTRVQNDPCSRYYSMHILHSPALDLPRSTREKIMSGTYKED